ncbi:MAG TPA: hypothetical protein VFH68_17180 [Polyangia bacterium]|nr:hypothetical protein [Polyangia bacterium]
MKLASIVSIAAVGGIASGVVWWTRPTGLPNPGAERAPASSLAPGAAGASASSELALRRVSALAGQEDPAAVSELIGWYGKLASTPGSLDARKAAFRSLLAYPNMVVGLEAGLAAIAADPTPRQQDPMWPFLVQGVASLWDGVTIQHGRDLVMIEQRPKPRDVLLESLAEVPPGKLSDSQRAALAADLIDLYPQLKPEQRPAVDRALAALGGSDLIEILARRGLGDNSHLKAAIEERRAQEAARASAGPAGHAPE